VASLKPRSPETPPGFTWVSPEAKSRFRDEAERDADAALKQFWHFAHREASTLAYADAFRAIMLAFVLATLLVSLLRQVRPAAAPSASH
jgi:hypothetical protein